MPLPAQLARAAIGDLLTSGTVNVHVLLCGLSDDLINMHIFGDYPANDVARAF